MSCKNIKKTRNGDFISGRIMQCCCCGSYFYVYGIGLIACPWCQNGGFWCQPSHGRIIDGEENHD